MLPSPYWMRNALKVFQLLGNASMVCNQDLTANDEQQKGSKSENLAEDPDAVLNSIRHYEWSDGMVELPQYVANRIENKL